MVSVFEKCWYSLSKCNEVRIYETHHGGTSIQRLRVAPSRSPLSAGIHPCQEHQSRQPSVQMTKSVLCRIVCSASTVGSTGPFSNCRQLFLWLQTTPTLRRTNHMPYLVLFRRGATFLCRAQRRPQRWRVDFAGHACTTSMPWSTPTSGPMQYKKHVSLLYSTVL